MGIKPKPRGKPLAKGYDPRRNVKGGRPRTATLLAELVLDILAEEIDASHPITEKIEKATQITHMLRRMVFSPNAADHSEVLSRGFGTLVTQSREISDVENFILSNLDLFTQGQIDRLAAGESKMGILSEVLRSMTKKK